MRGRASHERNMTALILTRYSIVLSRVTVNGITVRCRNALVPDVAISSANAKTITQTTVSVARRERGRIRAQATTIPPMANHEARVQLYTMPVTRANRRGTLSGDRHRQSVNGMSRKPPRKLG